MILEIINIRDLFNNTADLIDNAATEVYNRPNVTQNFSGYYSKPAKEGDPHCFCILAACQIYLNDLSTEEAVKLFQIDLFDEDWLDTPSPDEILAQADIPSNIWIDHDLTPAIDERYNGMYFDLIGNVLNDKYRLTPTEISAKLREFASNTPEDIEVTIDDEGYVVPKDELG